LYLGSDRRHVTSTMVATHATVTGFNCKDWKCGTNYTWTTSSYLQHCLVVCKDSNIVGLLSC
jgi:hypothetical protein